MRSLSHWPRYRRSLEDLETNPYQTQHTQRPLNDQYLAGLGTSSHQNPVREKRTKKIAGSGSGYGLSGTFSARNVNNLVINTYGLQSISANYAPVHTPYPVGAADGNVDDESDSDADSCASSSHGEEDVDGDDEEVSEAPSTGSTFAQRVYCSDDDDDEDGDYEMIDAPSNGSLSEADHDSDSVYDEDAEILDAASSAIDGTWVQPSTNAADWDSHDGAIDGRPAMAFLWQTGVGTLTDYPVSTSPRMS